MRIGLNKAIFGCAIAVWLLLTCVSCSAKKDLLGEINETLASQYHIKIDSKSDSLVKSSTIFRKSWFLELETDKDAFIGNIDKLLFDENKIFVLDKDISQAVFIYNSDGRLIKKIDERGQGPREFLKIRDVTLDKNKKRICLLDQAGNKINFYDYEGEFLESKPIPFSFSSFDYIDSSIIAFDLQTAYNVNDQIDNHYLVTADIEGIIHNKAFPYSNDEKSFSYWSSRHIRRFKDNVFFQPRYRNTIYQVKKDEVIPWFFLDFQGKEFPNNGKIEGDEHFRDLKQKYSYFSGEYVDLENVACFVINTPEEYFYLLYSKNTKRTIPLKPLMVEDFISGFFRAPFERFNDSTIVTFAHAHQVLLAKNAYFSYLEEEGLGDDMFPDLTENDNPVLFFYNIYEL